MWKLEYVSSGDDNSNSAMWPKVNPHIVNTPKFSGLMQFIMEAMKNGVTLDIRPDEYGRFTIKGCKGKLSFSQVVAPWIFEDSRYPGVYEEQLLLALRNGVNQISDTEDKT